MFRTLLVCCFILSIFSCKEDDNQLSRDDQTEVDTLFRDAKIKLDPMLDSLCKIRRREIYDHAFDSIFQERMTRINRLKQLQ